MNRAEILDQFSKLLDVMDELREKCPWDKEQTMETIRTLTIEETFELSDAIIQKDSEEIKKELGDILLHIVFYCKIASETNEFNVGHVIESLIGKLVRRHPHIYGDVEANDSEKVKLHRVGSGFTHDQKAECSSIFKGVGDELGRTKY